MKLPLLKFNALKISSLLQRLNVLFVNTKRKKRQNT
jgi:hypothetical protein